MFNVLNQQSHPDHPDHPDQPDSDPAAGGMNGALSGETAEEEALLMQNMRNGGKNNANNNLTKNGGIISPKSSSYDLKSLFSQNHHKNNQNNSINIIPRHFHQYNEGSENQNKQTTSNPTQGEGSDSTNLQGNSQNIGGIVESTDSAKPHGAKADGRGRGIGESVILVSIGWWSEDVVARAYSNGIE